MKINIIFILFLFLLVTSSIPSKKTFGIKERREICVIELSKENMNISYKLSKSSHNSN